jgi:hypothetical protein
MDFQGRRLPDGTKQQDLEPGDYCKVASDGDLKDFWLIRPPNNREGKSIVGHLSPKVHKIVEQQDGTITVTPSIKQMAGSGENEWEFWHGHLVNGIWHDIG